MEIPSPITLIGNVELDTLIVPDIDRAHQCMVSLGITKHDIYVGNICFIVGDDVEDLSYRLQSHLKMELSKGKRCLFYSPAAVLDNNILNENAYTLISLDYSVSEHGGDLLLALEGEAEVTDLAENILFVDAYWLYKEPDDMEAIISFADRVGLSIAITCLQ